jgi:hypothetical protein
VCVFKVPPHAFILIVEYTNMVLANVQFPFVSAYSANIHMQHDIYIMEDLVLMWICFLDSPNILLQEL